MKKRISLAEPVTELRRIPIVDCGEPLVDYLRLCPLLVQSRPYFTYRRETLARKSVAEALCIAAERLTNDYRLAVVEGWRPHHIQKRMYLSTWNRFRDRHPDWSEVKLKRVANRYTAPLDSRVPPPHTTGGAVDVVLVDVRGERVDMNAPYGDSEPRGFAFDAPGLSEQARDRRQALAEALTGTVLTNYPSEWWHWSYGDQGWAYRGGYENALYGPIEPEGYVPTPEDVSEDPLERAFPD